jgi:hypothetical protein
MCNELFQPIYVQPGNHHTTDWWWASVKQMRIKEAIKLAMNDPGPSLRAQLFVYWPEECRIRPEIWNQYETHFNALASVKGFQEAIKPERSKI